MAIFSHCLTICSLTVLLVGRCTLPSIPNEGGDTVSIPSNLEIPAYGTEEHIIEYNGFHIRVQRPKSYTWHLNTQIQDEDLEYYKRLHDMYEQLQDDVKEARADLKRKAEKLAKKYPDSESIKHGFTVAIMA